MDFVETDFGLHYGECILKNLERELGFVSDLGICMGNVSWHMEFEYRLGAYNVYCIKESG